MQGAAPVTALNLGFGLACLRQGGVGGHCNESVESRIQFLDARQAFCLSARRARWSLGEAIHWFAGWIAASVLSPRAPILSSHAVCGAGALARRR